MARSDAGLYVYAITDAALPARMRLLGRELRTRSVGEISAVVGVDRQRPPLTPDALHEQHAIAVRLARRTRAILPARFGSVLTGAALESLLSRRADAIQAALDHVRDHVQMTVRVSGEPDATRPAEERQRGGAAYLKSRRETQRHLPPEMRVVQRIFGTGVSDERAEAGGGRLRLTVFHLVPARAIGGYRRKARALQAELPSLEVTVTGPWPPYAFSPELV